VRFLLFAGGDLDIEIKQGLAIDDSHTQLFTLSCVDQHTFHCRISLQALEPLPRVARYPKVSRRAIRLDRSTGRGIACVLSKSRRFPGASAHLVHTSPETLCHRKGGKQSPIRTATMSGLFQPACPSNLSSGTRARAGITAECAYGLSLDPLSSGPDDGAIRGWSVAV